jgi:hypothetical protein
MSITCLLSNTANDFRCPVCGQGFLVFAERATATVREQVKRSVQRAMRSHHAGAQGALYVHPTTAFEMEDENAGAGDGLRSWFPLNNPAAALCM